MITTAMRTEADAPSGRGPLLGTSLLLFLVSAAATLHWSRSMAGGMAMPGGWTLSMVWTLMPAQTWAGSGARFVAMWLVMMVAMMLPPLLRRSDGRPARRRDDERRRRRSGGGRHRGGAAGAPARTPGPRDRRGGDNDRSRGARSGGMTPKAPVAWR